MGRFCVNVDVGVNGPFLRERGRERDFNVNVNEPFLRGRERGALA